MPHSVLSWNAAKTKITEDTITNSVASPRPSAPVGISRIAVRGLSASILASTRRLKPIAALRADTIATTTQTICRHSNGAIRHASSAPVSANGSANTECEKRMNDR